MKTITNERGVTFISLLVGILISMMAILASLTLYKNLVHVSAEAKIDSAHDGQLASAMLTTQLEILAAGYGIDDADGNHVAVVDGGNTLSVYWRYLDGANYICRGITETGLANVQPYGLNYRVLTLVEDEACDAVTALTDFAWDGEVGVLARWPEVEGLQVYINDNQKLFSAVIAEGDCAPLGSSNPSNHIQVILSAPATAALYDPDNNPLTDYQFCLPNTVGL